MYIKDYDLIENIENLFTKNVIIYGAGNIGKEIAILLEDANIKIDCFCDKNKKKVSYLGYGVIDINQLKIKTEQEDCIIIVASNDYCEEIIQDLERECITGYICTDFAVWVAIDFNINNQYFDEKFVKSYKNRRNYFVYNIQNATILSIFSLLCRYYNEVLVYQPAKVGSKSIQKTLNEYGIPNIHVHYIFRFSDYYEKYFGKELNYRFQKEKNFLKEHLTKRKLKIITLVREPISRAISDYMQMFTCRFCPYKISDNFMKNAEEVIFTYLKNDYLYKWFDEELKELTEIDVFKYPFDKEKGYAWIKEENAEILVLKMENMNENEEIIGKFVGIPNLKLLKANIGSEKQYKYLYQELKKRIQIPQELIEQQYMYNKRFEHFYTEEEKRAFLKKWEKKR